MAKLVSHARQLRYELQAKLGREVTIEEVATAIGVDRRVVMKIERNEMQRIDRETVEALAAYYQNRGLNGMRVLEFELENTQKNGTPGLVPIGI